MTESLTSWPDTTSTEPPADRWRLAAWLLGRHPDVAELVTRVPGIVGRNMDGQGGGLDISIESLAAAFIDYDVFTVARHEYRTEHPAPEDFASLDAWSAAGPQPTPEVHAFNFMGGSEMRTLRLLAFLAESVAVPMHLPTTRELLGGPAFLADWCRAIQAV